MVLTRRRAVEAILGHMNHAWPTRKDNFAYRFLIPTAELVADPETVQFTEDDDGRMKIIVDEGRRLVWYDFSHPELELLLAEASTT